LDLGQAQAGLGIVARDPVAAREHRLEPAADARAVDGGDHRHRQRLEPRQDRLARARQRLTLERAPDLREVLDVGAGDEVVRLGARQHDRLHVAARRELREQPVQLGHQRLAERVDLLAGDVDREHEHAVRAALGAECAHATAPLSWSRAIASGS
jgi:hypothetical protein